MKKILLLVSSLLFPVAAFAQLLVPQPITNVNSLFSTVLNILSLAVPFIISISIVYFLWAIFKFIKSAGDEKARGAAKGQLIYSIVALAVMVSVYGLINFVTGSIGLNNQRIEGGIPGLPPIR